MIIPVAAILLSVLAAPAPAQARDLFWSLHVASYVYFQDGHTTASWHPRLGRRDPYSDDVFAAGTLCVFETNENRYGDAAYGWHVSLLPVRQTESELVVQ